jgi:aspartokinase/homoserine dehydrogenase 1
MKVLKFGGTSVGSIESLLNVKTIVENQKDRCVVVVSALGGITDRLIGTARKAAAHDAAYEDDLDEYIVQRHYEVIDGVLPEAVRSEVSSQLNVLFVELYTLYMAVDLMGDVPEAMLNVIVSYGERMSSIIVSRLIEGAALVDSRKFIRTNFSYGRNMLQEDATASLINETFAPLAGEKTVIVPGFISSDAEGRITNLGRGGSDYTAAILAAQLNASVLEIWTDVDGFMTADPRVVPTAKVIDHLTYIEAMELCNFGAKVVYPPTIYPVFHKNIPIIIKNTFNASAPGTTIDDKDDAAANSGETRTTYSGVSSISDTCLLTLRGTVDTKRVAGVLPQLGDGGLFIAPARHNCQEIGLRQSVAERAVDEFSIEFSEEILHGTMDEVELKSNLVTLTLVGKNLTAAADLTDRLVSMLNAEGIPVTYAPQSAQFHTLTCMVPMTYFKQAINTIHSSFF